MLGRPETSEASEASMRRLVCVKGQVFAFAFDFSFSRVFLGFAFGLASFACSFIHLGASIRTLMSRLWARCMLVSDTDERVLLSKARPRGPSLWSQSPEHKMSMNLWQSRRIAA
jgi:hypothetical protein